MVTYSTEHIPNMDLTCPPDNNIDLSVSEFWTYDWRKELVNSFRAIRKLYGSPVNMHESYQGHAMYQLPEESEPLQLINPESEEYIAVVGRPPDLDSIPAVDSPLGPWSNIYNPHPNGPGGSSINKKRRKRK